MTVKEFIKDCKTYGVKIDEKKLYEICHELSIETIRRGVSFSNVCSNRMLKCAFMDINIPEEYSHNIMDHAYTLVSDIGREYCIINPYYNPKYEDKLFEKLENGLNKCFERGIEKSEEQRISETIEVWDNGIYNANSTIGIFIPENIIYYELLASLEKTRELLFDVNVDNLSATDQKKMKQIKANIINIDNALDVLVSLAPSYKAKDFD